MSRDGGPAFPRIFQFENGEHENVEGMTLRDLFAAAAVSGAWARSGDNDTYTDIARAAYKTADAMLKERAK